jgi:phenylacetate-coenzyme A ligase PaaK-like adenylate-forming protein
MWDPGAERMSADERAGLQARRLDDLLGRLAERSPLYRERLAGAGIGPGARALGCAGAGPVTEGSSCSPP